MQTYLILCSSEGEAGDTRHRRQATHLQAYSQQGHPKSNALATGSCLRSQDISCASASRTETRYRTQLECMPSLSCSCHRHQSLQPPRHQSLSWSAHPGSGRIALMPVVAPHGSRTRVTRPTSLYATHPTLIQPNRPHPCNTPTARRYTSPGKRHRAVGSVRPSPPVPTLPEQDHHGAEPQL